MEIEWHIPRELKTQGTGIALVEGIVERKLEEYLANRFEFVNIQKKVDTEKK